MKRLPKHLQPRGRYLAVKIESSEESTINRRMVQEELWRAARELLGDAGSAKVDLRVVDCSVSTGLGYAIVRTNRGEKTHARAAIACMNHVAGQMIGVSVLGVSGTVRGCKEKYLDGL